MSVPIRPQVIQTEGLGNTLAQGVQGLIAALGEKNRIQQAKEEWALKQQQILADIEQSKASAKLTGTQDEKWKQDMQRMKDEDKRKQEEFAAEDAAMQELQRVAGSGGDVGTMAQSVVNIKDPLVASKFIEQITRYQKTVKDGGDAQEAVAKGQSAQVQARSDAEVEATLKKDPHLRRLRTISDIGAMPWYTTQMHVANSDKVTSREGRLADIRTYNMAIEKAMTAYKDTEQALIKRVGEAAHPSIAESARAELAALRAKTLQGYITEYETEAASAMGMDLATYRANRRRAVAGAEREIKTSLTSTQRTLVRGLVTRIGKNETLFREFLNRPDYSPDLKAAVIVEYHAQPK